jgi:hypothetical protein
MTRDHVAELKTAKTILEKPGLAAKLSNLIGKPIEKGMELLPEKWSEAIGEVSTKALKMALETALVTLDKDHHGRAKNVWHKIAVTGAGAGGGAFGLPALAVELPVSTSIILRSIADIARSEDEDLRAPSAKLACLEVFAIGGNTVNDDAAESGYFAVRAALAKAVSEAAAHIARSALMEPAPQLLRFISQIASRFGVAVSQKAAAQVIPVIGAIGGALINLAFIDHFQNMARGHFIVRRLERHYGPEVVRHQYENLNIDDNGLLG